MLNGNGLCCLSEACSRLLSVRCDTQVRTVSAKALGAMVKGMGESSFDDLLPWLMETLASEQSSVDRSGAAQGESGHWGRAPGPTFQLAGLWLCSPVPKI